MYSKMMKKIALGLAVLPMLASQNILANEANTNGAGNQVQPIELLIKFDIAGTPSMVNFGAFTVGGPGYATITTSSGEILDNRIPGLETAELSGAEIAFQPPVAGDHPAIQRFTCLDSSCTFTFNDGSVLEADPDVPLDGRMVTAGLWGLVDNGNLDFNPPGVFPQRILGCGGLRGVAGPLTGTVGSVCFNGVFNVPGDIMSNPNAELTGSSNCTITLHTPVFPPSM